MAFLRKVNIHNQDFFYLFHTVNKPLFRKYKRYIGKKEPTKEKLKILKKKLIEDIKNKPESFNNQNRENIVALIQELQEKNKFVSEENVVKLSKELGIPATEIFGVITFYSQFKLTKPGKYKISICRGTACHVKKSDELEEYLEELLKIKPEETSKDGKFTLECVNCIGACARAPAMMINNQVYGELTKEKIKNIVRNLE